MDLAELSWRRLIGQHAGLGACELGDVAVVGGLAGVGGGDGPAGERACGAGRVDLGAAEHDSQDDQQETCGQE
jgi:hypothetical protein